MRSRMFCVSIACLLLAGGCSDAGRQSLTAAPSPSDTPVAKATGNSDDPEQLIDRLRDLDSITVGLHPTALAVAFLANDDEPEFAGGVFGSEAPQANPVMKRLVQLGIDAIPALISHLDDSRPTKLKVGSQGPIMVKWFADEYDPRERVDPSEPDADLDLGFDRNTFERSIDGDYVVKVGDVCYVLIGQIVNRNLLAVRYQPSGCMVVNSPLESPDLVDRVKGDWDALTKQEHIDSLICDLENAHGARDGRAALERLRYYYPETLARLRKGATSAGLVQ